MFNDDYIIKREKSSQRVVSHLRFELACREASLILHNLSDRHANKSSQQAQFRRTVLGAKVGARSCRTAGNSVSLRRRQAGRCQRNEGSLPVGNEYFQSLFIIVKRYRAIMVLQNPKKLL